MRTLTALSGSINNLGTEAKRKYKQHLVTFILKATLLSHDSHDNLLPQVAIITFLLQMRELRHD